MSDKMRIREKLVDKKEESTTLKDSQQGIVRGKWETNVDENLGIMSVTDSKSRKNIHESDNSK